VVEPVAPNGLIAERFKPEEDIGLHLSVFLSER
jgi:hypothetical protein